MPDSENPLNPASNPPPNPEPPTGEPPETDWKAEAEKWRGISRKHEEANKVKPERLEELRKAEADLQKIRDANKTEFEKVTAAKEAADKDAAAARTELSRMRVALRKGLSEVQAKRLLGTTEEELEADADELLTTFRPAEPPNSGNGNTRPRENLRPGTAPNVEPALNVKEVVDKMMANR